MAAGGRLQGDLHWLAVGDDWESRLFGEIAGAVGRPAVGTGQGWGGRIHLGSLPLLSLHYSLIMRRQH